MGMFDFFRSSYDLGEQFTNVVCQTKDIEDGIGGTMTDYWLDPSGQLWCPIYHDTHTLEIYEEGHPNYDPERKFLNFEWVPTGKHGKYRVHRITKYVIVYPENWKGAWHDWPECRIHFVDGKVKNYQNLTKGEQLHET